jgi:hypothetical protein
MLAADAPTRLLGAVAARDTTAAVSVLGALAAGGVAFPWASEPGALMAALAAADAAMVRVLLDHGAQATLGRLAGDGVAQLLLSAGDVPGRRVALLRLFEELPPGVLRATAAVLRSAPRLASLHPALAAWMADAADEAAGGALWSGPRQAWITGMVGTGPGTVAGAGSARGRARADAALVADLAALLARGDMREPRVRDPGQPRRLVGTVAGYVARFLPGDDRPDAS